MILENLDTRDLMLIGSHNQDSVNIAKKIIEERKIQERVRFAQLKGFSD
jgi:hypothetical protein